jgi:hypothetical protein
MTNKIGQDPRDRELGEFWEDRFCDITRRYGWEAYPFQRKRGAMFVADNGERYICPDVWILRRGDRQYACEIKHKAQAQNGCYGFEKYRADSLLALEAAYTNAFGPVEALYIVHNWAMAGGKYVTENRERDWHAQLLRVCEEHKIVSMCKTLYGGAVTEEAVVIHYYKNPFKLFAPLKHFL